MDDATSVLTRDEGFAALTRRLRAPLTHFFLRRSKSSADAEEMVQDLFLRLMRRADLMSRDAQDHRLYAAAASYQDAKMLTHPHPDMLKAPHGLGQSPICQPHLVLTSIAKREHRQV